MLAKTTEKEKEEETISDEELAEINTARSMLQAGSATVEDLAEELGLTMDELLDRIDGLVFDAKLSAEQRKRLKGSTFCGPKGERSFPVPDCAHVVAARRLVGRYRGQGNKATILACVARKARALGCSRAGKDGWSKPHFASLESLRKALEPSGEDGRALYNQVVKDIDNVLERPAFTETGLEDQPKQESSMSEANKEGSPPAAATDAHGM